MRQRIVSGQVHTTHMTKHTTTMAAFGALVCAAGVFYWAHGLGPSSHVSKASPPVATSPTPANPEKVAPSGPATPPKSIYSTDRPGSVEAATPLHAGEVLEFAADVAKLSNVANLRLQIVERRNFFGKAPGIFRPSRVRRTRCA